MCISWGEEMGTASWRSPTEQLLADRGGAFAAESTPLRQSCGGRRRNPQELSTAWTQALTRMG